MPEESSGEHTATSDRPREKLDRAGAAGLGNNELIALIIGHGHRRRNVMALAHDVLTAAGGLHGLTHLDRQRLVGLSGIGEAQASRLQAAIELGRRTVLAQRPPRPQFGSPRDAAAYLLPQYGAHSVERFGVMLLDARHRLIATRLISTGLIDASLVHPREVFREAVLASASTVIAFHNHPTGDPTPSQADLHVTARLKQAGIIIGIELADHLILADERYYSMKEARIC
jgi:DNA repair protein RadC